MAKYYYNPAWALFLCFLTLCPLSPGAAARWMPAQDESPGPNLNPFTPAPIFNLSSRGSIINLPTLADGSLGSMPAKMLVYQSVLKEMDHTAATTPPPDDSADIRAPSWEQRSVVPSLLV